MLRTEYVDADRWASRSADVMATAITNAVVARGRCVVALSGSGTPLPAFAELAHRELPWNKITLIQVDERVAPLGSPDRNLTAQRELFTDKRLTWLPLPVDEADVDGTVADTVLRSYEARLAAVLGEGAIDLTHLGLGVDGHTASLVPGDPLLEHDGGLVAQSIEYNGARRLTLTKDAISASRRIVWLATGDHKAGVLKQLLAGDTSIPAGLISQARAIVITT